MGDAEVRSNTYKIALDCTTRVVLSQVRPNVDSKHPADLGGSRVCVTCPQVTVIIPVGVAEGDEFDVEIDAENVDGVEQQQNALDDDSLLGDIEALLDTHVDGRNEDLFGTTAAELKTTVAEKAQQQVLADPAFGELAGLLGGLTGSDSDASSESAESEDQPEPEPSDVSATGTHGRLPGSKRRYSMSLLPGAMDDFLAVVDLPTEADDMGQGIAENLTTLVT